jgi:hypothetical protein
MEAADDKLRTAPWGHLSPANQRRLATILSVQVPEVFRANRVIERETGYASEIGRNMMVDVLSHLGTLAAGTHLDHTQQASQLAKIEEHLRRALLEHPEEVVRDRTVDVEERWLTYQREAFPYREQGTLPNAPRHRELEEMRSRIHTLLESGRSKKPDETTWEESLTAAADITQAATLTNELADKLEQCVGAAQERRRADERDLATQRAARWSGARWAAGIAVTVGLAIGSYVVGRSDRPDPPPSATPSPPAQDGPPGRSATP